MLELRQGNYVQGQVRVTRVTRSHFHAGCGCSPSSHTKHGVQCVSRMFLVQPADERDNNRFNCTSSLGLLNLFNYPFQCLGFPVNCQQMQVTGEAEIFGWS